MIRDVTGLRVYNDALTSLPLVYDLASQIPDSHRKLRTQIIECGEAVAPQIAEGFGKKHSELEFKRFLKMALGSSDEEITHIREAKILALRVRNINQNLCDSLIERFKVESKQLQQLIKKWQSYKK